MRILLLVGPRGAGKTTACQRFLRRAGALGWRLGGILAPGRFGDDGGKTGMDIEDVATGERRTLGWAEADPERLTVGRFRMDEGVMSWSLDVVLQALALPGAVVLVDEIGPLELRQGRGLAPVLDALGMASARAALLVVREELGAELAARLDHLSPRTVRLDATARDAVPDLLVDALCGSSGVPCGE